MAMPEDRKPPVGTGGISESDLLAGGIDPDLTNDLADVSDDAVRTLVALLLSSPSTDQAQRLICEVPRPLVDPVLNWWLIGVSACVGDLSVSTPTTAAAAAIKAGYPPPPALRGHVVSSGWAMVAEVAAVPLTAAESFVAIVREGSVRRAAERAITRMADAVWRGDLTELAVIVQREAAGALALVAEVVANG